MYITSIQLLSPETSASIITNQQGYNIIHASIHADKMMILLINITGVPLCKNMKGVKKSLGTSCFKFSDGIAVVFNELVVGSQSYLIDPNSCLLVDIENEEGGS